jgi:ADP-heptose:LPS heptosyltransferase
MLQEIGINPLLPFIVCAPGASCDARRYDALRFARVVNLLQQQSGLPIVLVGSSKEHLLEQVIFSAGRNRNIVSLIGKTSLVMLAAIIKLSSLVIANDSGSMHISDAFGRPMVILFSGTDVQEQWKPRRAQARLLMRTTRCAPCYLFHCAHNMECLDIPPQEVANEAKELLQLTAHSARPAYSSFSSSISGAGSC